MRIEQACMILGKSVNTLAYHFDRTKNSLAKKGIFIKREGVGKNAEYMIEYADGSVVDAKTSLVIKQKE